jgi:4-amino-4-deoxy-L-arabinose transferase-like glycosyltransferase
MPLMTSQEKRRNLIRKGRRHFIVVHGVFRVGLGAALLVIAFDLLSKPWNTGHLVISLLTGLGAGALWGAWIWSFIQPRHEQTNREVDLKRLNAPLRYSAAPVHFASLLAP